MSTRPAKVSLRAKFMHAESGSFNSLRATKLSGTTCTGRLFANSGISVSKDLSLNHYQKMYLGGSGLKGFQLQAKEMNNNTEGELVLLSNDTTGTPNPVYSPQLSIYQKPQGTDGIYFDFDGKVNFSSGATVNGSTAVTSDDRVKHNETPIQNATQTLEKVKVYDYDQSYEMKDAKFNGDMKGIPHFKMSGVIAQQVFSEVPELKHLVNEGSDTQPYSFNYTGMIAYLTRAVQELSQEVKDLKAQQQSGAGSASASGPSGAASGSGRN